MQTQETISKATEVATEATSLVQLAIDRLESLPRDIPTTDRQRIWQAVAALEEAITRLGLVGTEAKWY
jgi:hypothetical protein